MLNLLSLPRSKCKEYLGPLLQSCESHAVNACSRQYKYVLSECIQFVSAFSFISGVVARLMHRNFGDIRHLLFMGVQNQRRNLMPFFANISNVFFHKQLGGKGKKCTLNI